MLIWHKHFQIHIFFQIHFHFPIPGECGAGKSSLINLLLSEDLLPVSHLASTSTICELHYSSNKRFLRLCYPDNDKKPPFEINLLKPPESMNEVREILSSYITNPAGRMAGAGGCGGGASGSGSVFSYDHVEIHWPFQLLREGVVLVDSPGVGEDDELTETVKRYIPKASAFIYVINTPNAGGIHPDRVNEIKSLAPCI